MVAILSCVQAVLWSVVFINAMVAVLAVGGSSMFARQLLRKIGDLVRIKHTKRGAGVDAVLSHQSRLIIFGAAAAGRQLAVGFN